jgi:hypothetical protein
MAISLIDEQGLTVLVQGARLLRGGIEEHGIVGPRVSAEAFPELPPKGLQGLSRYLALPHLAVRFRTVEADGARMDGERDRMTGTGAAGTRPGRRITDSISTPRSQCELPW